MKESKLTLTISMPWLLEIKIEERSLNGSFEALERDLRSGIELKPTQDLIIEQGDRIKIQFSCKQFTQKQVTAIFNIIDCHCKDYLIEKIGTA